MSDIRKYFTSTSTSSGRESTTDTAETQSVQHSEDDSNGYAPGPSKMVCNESSRKYKKKLEKSFTWLHLR